MSEFVTPIRPIERGRPWCVFAQRGTYEWMVHPDDVVPSVIVDGQRLSVSVIDEYPAIGAVHILAVDPTVNEGFIEAAAA